MENCWTEQELNSPQICSHLQCSNNIRADNLTITVDKHIDTFHHIQEDLNIFIKYQAWSASLKKVNQRKRKPYLIFLVTHPFTTPWNCICYSHWRPLCDFHPVCIGLNKLTENFRFSKLRVPKVYDFIE